MRCNNPIRINKNTSDEAIVPCGHCWQCRDNKFKEWSFRLKEEWKNSKNAWFLTPTYSDHNLPMISPEGEFLTGAHNRGSPTIYMPAISDYIRALRQEQARIYAKYRKLGKPIEKWKIRFYAVAEYGEQFERPHYHIIIFNLYDIVDVEKVWAKGVVTKSVLTEGRIKYVSGYIHDKDKNPKGTIRPRPRMSQGIGKSYIERAKSYHLSNEVLFSKTEGKTQRLPRYYAERIFDGEDEKLEKAKQKQKDYVEDQIEHDHKKKLEQNWQNQIKIKERKRHKKL